MELKVVIKDEVYDEVITLMENINDLNKGNEIGGWLTGDYNVDGDNITLYLDSFIIPTQKVSKTEVDISPESMTDMMKEFGTEVTNRVKAHWHIHPFGTGDTNWSGTDEEKIEDFMDMSKGREIFTFLLSSEDKIKARMVFNMKTTILGNTFTMREDINDVEVVKESTPIKDINILKKLKNRIETKVKEDDIKITYNNITKDDWYGESQKEYLSELYFINKSKNRVHVSVDNGFWEYIQESMLASDDLKSPDMEKKYTTRTVLNYVTSKKDAKKLKKLIKEELDLLENEYYVEKYSKYEEDGLIKDYLNGDDLYGYR